MNILEEKIQQIELDIEQLQRAREALLAILSPPARTEQAEAPRTAAKPPMKRRGRPPKTLSVQPPSQPVSVPESVPIDDAELMKLRAAAENLK